MAPTRASRRRTAGCRCRDYECVICHSLVPTLYVANTATEPGLCGGSHPPSAHHGGGCAREPCAGDDGVDDSREVRPEPRAVPEVRRCDEGGGTVVCLCFGDHDGRPWGPETLWLVRRPGPARTRRGLRFTRPPAGPAERRTRDWRNSAAACAAIIAVMVVAIMTSHWPKGFFNSGVDSNLVSSA